MTTSGVATLTMTRNQIINSAALKINAVSNGVAMGGNQLVEWALNLNMLTKQYQSKGLRVWKQTEAQLFLKPGQIRYGVGSGQTDHCAETSTISNTAVTTSCALGLTSIPVDSTSGFAINNKIGIVVDGGSIFWTTVLSFTSNTVALAAALPDSARAGNLVFCYATDIVFPLEVYNPRRYTFNGGNEVPMVLTSRMDWNNLQAKNSPGDATQLFFDKQRINGFFNVWQVQTTTVQAVRFAMQKPIEVFTAPGDNPDFPDEWCMTLVFNLAAVMIPNHAVSPERKKYVLGMAATLLDQVEGFDREQTSVQIVPDMGP